MTERGRALVCVPWLAAEEAAAEPATEEAAAEPAAETEKKDSE